MMQRTRDSASTSPSWKLISHFGFAARLHRDRPIFNRGMDLSLCGAAPAGIRGDEDLFDWVSLRKRGGKKRGRHPCFLEFDPEPNGILSLAGESKLAFFFQILLLLLQSLHTCRFELSSFSIEIFKIYAVIGICMKEFNHPIVQTCFFLPDPFVALPRPPWYTCQFELSSFSIEIFKIYAVIRICMKESNHPIVQICLFLRGGILLLPSKASLTLVDSNYRIFRSKFSRFRR